MARTSAAIAGRLCRLCEGHVALRHTPRFKTKTSAPVPGLLSVQSEWNCCGSVKRGGIIVKNVQRALAHTTYIDKTYWSCCSVWATRCDSLLTVSCKAATCYLYFSLVNLTISFSTLLDEIVQELCESRGGRPGLSVLTSLLVSVDVKIYCTVLRHWSQLVPNMSHDIWGH